ncbi:hypothetical protein [Roseibium sediminicola]|uniref:Uncharacterized protein n=1 Tax=Roseibium sediminicola TaxID=2933272 RepID=A0ABT0GRA8_9HYPH|nr:hypothetical protein [Roseibium sp. CAU 1639]MCK7611978.1 hypothetical protein [Roseibium sp. CAU 1639]
MKKRIDIEKLLKWAYCEELPKGGSGGAGMRAASAWASVESFMQLLTKVDDNEYGVVPTLSPFDGEPHEDALKVHAAVNALDQLELDFPENWNPMPCIEEHPEECASVMSQVRFGLRQRKRSASDIVRRHAILGGCPDWHGETPVLVARKNRNGQDAWFRMIVQQGSDPEGHPVEYRHETEDGWCRVQKAPKRGAYRKFHFDPDPVPCMIARGEYQIWCSCLAELVENLSENMELWHLNESNMEHCPWEPGAARAPRILMPIEESY